MLVFSYLSGEKRFVKGQTLRELDQATARLGQVNFTTPPEFAFGVCKGVAFKQALQDVIEVADDVYEAKAAEEKAAGEKQKAEREAQKSLLKTDAQYQAAKVAMEAAEQRAVVAEAMAAVLQGRTFRGRIRRAVAWVKRAGRKGK